MLPLTEQEMIMLLAIFSEEVWELIFDQIENIDDQANFVQASQCLTALLGSKRTIYLFPQVLSTLHDQKYLTSKDSKHILNCRLVCSKWKCSINTFLEIRPYHFKLKDNVNESLSREEITDVAYGTYFRLFNFSINQLRNQIIPEISKPSYQNYNPFPSRFMDITLNQSNRRDYQQLGRYSSVAEEFLGKVGHHFWHARIETIRAGKSLFKQIRKYARLMPNLKSLHLINLGSGQDDGRIVDYMSNKHVSFPNLKNLEIIRFNNIPKSLANEILAENMQVKIVEIVTGWAESFRISGNVEKLYILEDIFGKSEHLPRLQTLYLNVTSLEPSFSRIISKLKSIKDTLLELNLQIHHDPIRGRRWPEEWECSKKPLNLPKLEKLEVNLSSEYSLDFLLGLKSLQQLDLTVNSTGRKFKPCSQIGSDAEKTNFYIGDYANRFMECNIWELIPSLKIVCLKVRSGGRAKMYRRGQPSL